MTLIGVIDLASMMGPNGWAIEIVQLVVFIAFPMMYLFSFLTKGETLIVKLTRVFALLFVLSLLLDLLFSELGAPTTLADIPLVYLALYGIFANLAFAYLPKVEAKEEDLAEAEPVEEAQEEPVEE